MANLCLVAMCHLGPGRIFRDACTRPFFFHVQEWWKRARITINNWSSALGDRCCKKCQPVCRLYDHTARQVRGLPSSVLVGRYWIRRPRLLDLPVVEKKISGSEKCKLLHPRRLEYSCQANCSREDHAKVLLLLLRLCISWAASLEGFLRPSVCPTLDGKVNR